MNAPPKQHPIDQGAESGLAQVVCALSVALLALHAWFALSGGDPRMGMPHAVAWLLDTFVLIVLAGILWGIGKIVRGCPRGRRRAAHATLLLAGVLLAVYPASLAEFLAFPVSIFRADGASASFFVREYLGWRGLWPCLAMIAAAGLAMHFRWPALSPRRRMSLAILVLLLSTVTWTRPAPQPMVYAVQDLVKQCLGGRRRAVPSLTRPQPSAVPDERPVAELVQFSQGRALCYDHLLVLVLEGVTADRFESDFLSRPTGYYAHVQDRSAYFAGYHTTNLDSYTSLIAMLTSVLVPYRAYAAPACYQAVNEAPNLVATLARQGFRSLYICTFEHQPFVPVRQAWDRVMTMQDLNRKDGWVAVGGSKVEAGVEDRAALPAIVDFMRSHPRTLVMQEMIFGHSPQWMAKTGQSPLAYYDAYLQELLHRLEQDGLSDRTLLAVVSDHGDRADSANVANYRVPLLISGRGVSPARSADHLCHLDLPAILAHFLAGPPLPQARQSLVTVGSTERWIYGQIAVDGSCLFIDNDTGVVLTHTGSLDAGLLYRTFQRQLDAFAACYQR